MKSEGYHVAAPASATAISIHFSGGESAFPRRRYKLYALGAIFLLAFWSLLAGTVTLRWSSVGALARVSGDDFGFDFPLHNDLDALEMEEREKLVRHMWDVYAHSQQTRLPRFWQEAFEAAYEELAGDDVDVRNDAIAEIARMSIRMLIEEPAPTDHEQKVTDKKSEQKDDNVVRKMKS